jgi:NhaP-type Na+/H+ or K+/H+ antiporter
VESGLNDGVCVPLLFAAIAFAESNQTPALRGEILRDLIVELGVAAIVGAVVAIVVGSAYRTSTRRSWIEDNWAQVLPLAATATAYVAAHELGGSGFIAAFVAGLTYGRILGDRAHHTILLSEEVGNLASAVTFLVFGAAVVGPAIGEIDASTVVYAIASLTVVRMLPVALALAGSAAPPTLAFAGWFGPRGLATIVFMLTIVDESGLAGTATIVQVATVTVLVSVFAHGVTAPWLTDRYLAWSAR